MTKYRVIPPSRAKDEFYEYLYKIQLMSKCRNLIPTQYFKDLISYFEETENYERCEELFQVIKDRDDL